MIYHEPRKPSDALLMLILRWDEKLPHDEIPLRLKGYCEPLIFAGEAVLADGIWSLTAYGLERAEYLWAQE